MAKNYETLHGLFQPTRQTQGIICTARQILHLPPTIEDRPFSAMLACPSPLLKLPVATIKIQRSDNHKPATSSMDDQVLVRVSQETCRLCCPLGEPRRRKRSGWFVLIGRVFVFAEWTRSALAELGWTLANPLLLICGGWWVVGVRDLDCCD